MGSVIQNGVFYGTPTNEKERELLKKSGFVHVTGLRVQHPSGKFYIVGSLLSKGDLGHWDRNNGKTVIVTEGGEVWLQPVHQPISDNVLEYFAPHGQGAFVPCSSGEQPDFTEVMWRLFDPSFGLTTK